MAGEIDPVRRMVASQAGPIEPLHASHRAQLLDRLRQVAAHFTDSGHLMHCEWVWDGHCVWIVQADRVSPAPGEADRYLGSRVTLPTSETALKILRSLPPVEAARWHKLARRTLMQELGMPVAPVYFLSGEVCGDLAHHQPAFDQDFAALSMEGRIPVVLRCDLRESAKHSGLSLPTSEPLLSATDAEAFIGRVEEHFAAVGITRASWAVLPAQLVSAHASAMVQARPGAQTIRLDALWGFPDGVGCLAHDSYLYRIDRERFSEACRCKQSCLLYEPDRGWHFASVGEPHDWGHVLNIAEVHTAASWSRRIADHLQREVQLMVLARLGGARGATAMRPWHYTDHIVPPWSPPVRWAPEQSAAMVRRPSDLDRLRGEQAKITGIHFAPLVEDRRDTGFIQEVAALAVELGVPVYFSGSVLGHTYYLLRSANAHVVLVGVDAPEATPDRYDKLVRDRIPEAVSRSGATAHVVRASPDQGVRLLKHKLIEEALEVWNAHGDGVRDELADLFEVLDELCRRLGLTRADVLAAQQAKRASRGGFEQLLYLEATAPESGGLDESRLFSTSPEPVVSGARRVVGPVSVERSDGQMAILRVPAAPPLRAGIPLYEYGISLAEANIQFRHDGLNLEIRIERIERPGTPGQLSLPIETP
jgi:predicted house-cleaning noncanonical NTP pyrophosphatase (MazG superfamily)